jgi:transcriptional regulator
MYLPRHFQETDTAVMYDFIRQHRLATLVTTDSEGLCANHIPMLIEIEDDGRAVLRGHVARANPLWKDLGAGADALAVFQDPGLYVTPSWYASKAETGKVVPTWNYMAVHAYGRARAVDDAAWLREFLTRLTEANEARRDMPWQLSDAPEDYVAAQLKAIVGIELELVRLVGKWKVSQNRLPKDIDGVVAGLTELDDPASKRMVQEVQARRRDR